MAQAIPRAKGIEVQGEQDGSETRPEDGSGRGILSSGDESSHDAHSDSDATKYKEGARARPVGVS